MTVRERIVVHQDALARAALMLGAAVLLMLGFAVGSMAHADEIAVNDSVLLDPFDPVPQIHFHDCDYDCGYHRCHYGCRRPVLIIHEPQVVIDDRTWCERMSEFDYNTHRWNGAMAYYESQADQYTAMMKERYGREWHAGDHPPDTGPYTGPLHDPCFVYRGGPEPADFEWRQDGDRWRYWHDHGWHDDGEGDRWHDGRHDDRHDGDHHDFDHHDGDHHDHP